MRNKLRRYGVALLTAALLVSCSKVPDGILSEKEMKAVLIDMQLAEAMISTDYKSIATMLRKKRFTSLYSASIK